MSIIKKENIYMYIVTVSFIGGGNRSTWRTPLTNIYNSGVPTTIDLKNKK
jgi:hypothetical protein